MTRPARADRTRVAVAGGKGGCGKTTTALGLALALVRRGHRPVVADADVDVPDLHIRAGVDREPGLPALAAGYRPARVLQASSTFPGVDVLAAGSASTDTDAALRRLDDLARPVLIDCPAGVGPDAATPLRAAGCTVVVTTSDTQSREDAAKTARMATALDAPPTVTVRRAREPGRGGANGSATGSPGTRHRIAESREVSVPEASGPPLRDDRTRERYERVVAALGW